MRRMIYFLATFFFCGVVFGQTEAAPEANETLEAALHALGLALNTGGVYLFVFLILKWKKKIRETAPQFIPMLAIVAGPVFNAIAVFVLQAAGIEIDFSPAIAALAGPGAVTIDQIYRQRKKAPLRGRLPA